MNRAVISTKFSGLSRLFAEGQRGAEVARGMFFAALPFFVWGAIASFLGFIVGFAAVILPPTGTFGIVATVGLVLLWVMPDLPKPPTRALPIAFFIVLLCMICIPNYYALDVPALPWISIRRLSLFALIMPLVIAVGGSSRFRADIREKLGSEKLISICLIGFLFWSGLAILSSSVVSQSMVQVVDDALTYYVPFVACLYLLNSAPKVERLIETICWFSLIVAALGVAEFFLQRRFYFDILPRWYLQSLMEANPAVAAMVTANPFRNGFYRASSLFSIPLSFGEFEMMIAPLGWYFLVHAKGTRGRVLGIGVTIATLLGIFASGSRGAYFGLFAALGAFVSLWIARNARQHKGSIVTAFAILIGAYSAVVIFALIMVSGRLHSIIFGSSSVDQNSADARWQQWALLKPHLWASPIFGYGRDMSGMVIGFYYPGATTPTVDSYVLSLLADVGIPGTLFFFGAIAFSVWTAGRRYIVDLSDTGAVAGALGCSALGFGVYRITLSQQENIFLFFVIVAAIIAISAANPTCDPCQASGERLKPRRIVSEIVPGEEGTRPTKGIRH